MKPRALCNIVALILAVGSVLDLVAGHYWTAFVSAFLAAAWFQLERGDSED